MAVFQCDSERNGKYEKKCFGEKERRVGRGERKREQKEMKRGRFERERVVRDSERGAPTSLLKRILQKAFVSKQVQHNTQNKALSQIITAQRRYNSEQHTFP